MCHGHDSTVNSRKWIFNNNESLKLFRIRCLSFSIILSYIWKKKNLLTYQKFFPHIRRKVETYFFSTHTHKHTHIHNPLHFKKDNNNHEYDVMTIIIMFCTHEQTSGKMYKSKGKREKNEEKLLTWTLTKINT